MTEHYGIDYEAKHISVRGHIYWAEYEEDEDHVLLSFETETAWDACNNLFEEINRLLWDELSISYRVCECSQYFSHFLSISHYCAPNFKCRVMEYYYHFSVFLTKCPELHFLL